MLRYVFTVFVLTALVVLHYAAALDYQSRFNFANSFFHKIYDRYQDKNVIVSPMSMQTVLAMTYFGAEGETATELRKGLFLENFSSKDAVAAEYEALLTSAAPPRWCVSMANRVYVGQNYEIAPSFADKVASSFKSQAEVINFADSTNAAKAINEWVESKTRNQIKNLVDAGSLDALTAAILVNAVYFKAPWMLPFKKEKTAPRNFSLNAQDTIQVDTMYRDNAVIGYAEFPEYDAKAIELKYMHCDVGMLIVLPNKVDGLKELEKNIDFADVLKKSETFRARLMDLYFPKFKFEFGLDALQPLKELGITKLFDSAADLSAMLKTAEPLYISDVKHKAFIAVNEMGTEAGGASSVHATNRMGHSQFPFEFIVDHPFLFAIKDSNAVYFTGHVIKP